MIDRPCGSVRHIWTRAFPVALGGHGDLKQKPGPSWGASGAGYKGLARCHRGYVVAKSPVTLTLTSPAPAYAGVVLAQTGTS